MDANCDHGPAVQFAHETQAHMTVHVSLDSQRTLAGAGQDLVTLGLQDSTTGKDFALAPCIITEQFSVTLPRFLSLFRLPWSSGYDALAVLLLRVPSLISNISFLFYFLFLFKQYLFRSRSSLLPVTFLFSHAFQDRRSLGTCQSSWLILSPTVAVGENVRRLFNMYGIWICSTVSPTL